jgi:maleylpyruvate isomerase
VTFFVERGLHALEALAHESAGLYLVGDEVTFADVMLVPQLYNARRLGIAVEPFAVLHRVERACESIPAFAAAHPSAQADRDPNV